MYVFTDPSQLSQYLICILNFKLLWPLKPTVFINFTKCLLWPFFTDPLFIATGTLSLVSCAENYWNNSRPPILMSGQKLYCFRVDLVSIGFLLTWYLLVFSWPGIYWCADVYQGLLFLPNCPTLDVRSPRRTLQLGDNYVLYSLIFTWKWKKFNNNKNI